MSGAAGPADGPLPAERPLTPPAGVEAAQLREILDQAPYAIAILDHELRYVFASRRWISDFKLPFAPDDMRGRSHYELFPEIPEPWKAIHRRCLSGATERSEEEAFRRADGSVDWLRWEVRPWRDAAGDIRGIVIFSEDISARKRAELKLERGEREFRQLADSIPQLAWIAAADGFIFWYNRRWYDYTGKTPAEMEGWGWQSVHDPRELPRVLERWRASIATGEPFDMEFPLRAADGRFRWFLTRITPMRDAAGELVRWFGTNTDIHEQRRSREFTARLLAVTTALSSARTIAEVSDVIIRHSATALDGQRAMLALVDQDRERLEVVGHHGIDAASLPAELPLDGPLPIQQSARTGQPIFLEDATAPPLVPLIRGPETRSALLTAFVLGGRSLGALAVAFDSARVFEADERAFIGAFSGQCGQAIDRARLFARLERALELRDEFLSIASHELKTPLTSLHLQLQMTRRGMRDASQAPSPEKLARVLDLSLRQVDRLTVLIEGLLDVSRIDAGKLGLTFEEVDLAQQARELLDRLADQLDAAGCEVRFAADGPVPLICDRFRVEQVLVNLLTNAMKYGAGTPIEVGVARLGGGARITIRDFGIGIEEAMHVKIFERFERAVSHRNISGLGLGLYIAREIVAAHGGTIRVESAPGAGARFTVDLPPATPAAVRAERGGAP